MNKCIAIPLSWEDYYWTHVQCAKTCWRFPNVGTRLSADAVVLWEDVCVCDCLIQCIHLPLCFCSPPVWQEQLKHSLYMKFLFTVIFQLLLFLLSCKSSSLMQHSASCLNPISWELYCSFTSTVQSLPWSLLWFKYACSSLSNSVNSMS